MVVAIVGSRRLDPALLYTAILRELPCAVSEIVSGGAAGPDSIAVALAQINNIPQTVFRPDYARYGKSAPLMRNRQIVDKADLLLAFWDGASRGTARTIEYCIRRGTPFRIIPL